MRVLEGALKPKLVLVAVVCLVATAGAQVPWHEQPRKPRALVYALEGLGALSGAAPCAGLGLGATGVALVLGVSFDPAAEQDKTGAYLALCVGAVAVAAGPACAGYGAAKVGEQLGEDGSTGWSIGGAYLGTAVAAGLISAGVVVSRPEVSIPLCVLGGFCLPAGAVLGYNLGIPRESWPLQLGSGGRLRFPEVALTGAELPDRTVELGMKVQLAGLRF